MEIDAPARIVARSVTIEGKKSRANLISRFAISKIMFYICRQLQQPQTNIIMKRLFALLLTVVVFAVGCEGSFDISSLLKDYLPDPVNSEAILDVDDEGNYVVCPEGGELSIDLSDVKKCLSIDLVSQFLITISDEGQEWIHIHSRLDDITDGTLVVVVDENTSDQKRYADIVLRPADSDFLNYTVRLVQMPAGYEEEIADYED